MEKNPNIIYPDNYLRVAKRLDEIGYFDLAEVIRYGNNFSQRQMNQLRYDLYWEQARDIMVENPEYEEDGESEEEYEEEEPEKEFQLPEHCRKQMMDWKIAQQKRKFTQNRPTQNKPMGNLYYGF